MDRAEIDGAVLEFEVQGAGEPVVFIHGAGIAYAARMLFTQPSLAASYQLIAYARRGYAGSSRPAGVLSIEEQAADSAALLRHLGIERAHVIGHSLGGVIALQLALDYPASVHTLALLEPALALGSSGPGYRESLQRGRQRYREAGPTVAMHEMMQARWPNYRERLEQVLPGAFDQAVADAATEFESELPGLLEWQADENRLRSIPHPVLSVLGAESEKLSPRFGEAHRWLMENLPDVQAYILPGAHHFLQIENPADMAAALAAFFARNPIHT